MLLFQINEIFGIEVANMEIVDDHNTRGSVERKEKSAMHMFLWYNFLDKVVEFPNSNEV